MSECATKACKKAINAANIPFSEIGMLIYAGVCHDGADVVPLLVKIVLDAP